MTTWHDYENWRNIIFPHVLTYNHTKATTHKLEYYNTTLRLYSTMPIWELTNDPTNEKRMRWSNDKLDDRANKKATEVQSKVRHIIHVKRMRQNGKWGKLMNKPDEVKQWRGWCDEKMHEVNGKWMRWICTQNLHILMHKQWQNITKKARWKVRDKGNGKWMRWKGYMEKWMRKHEKLFFGENLWWTRWVEPLSDCEAL